MEQEMSGKQVTASLICATYNQPKILDLVLYSISRQTNLGFELIIADDGSSNETTTVIKKHKLNFPIPIRHLWQKDDGFRKQKIHNEAIRTANADFLIFIDGDCFLAPDFVDDHIQIYLREKDSYVLMGRKAIELGETFTKNLTVSNVDRQLLAPLPFELFISYLQGESKPFFRKYSIKNLLIRKLLKADNVKDMLGANFSLPKQTMVDINGWNEDISLGEDGDVFLRLRNSGCKLIGMKYYATAYHLFHGLREELKKPDKNYERNLKIYDYVWASNGLIKSQTSQGES